MTDNNAKAIQLLTMARSLIADRGWCSKKAQMYSTHFVDGVEKMNYEYPVAFCLIGALSYADHLLTCSRQEIGHTNYQIAYVALKNAVGERYGHNVVRYNDQKGRTKTQVLVKYDQAIKALSSGS